MKFEFFFGRFTRNSQTPNLTKIRPAVAELLREDWRTDMTKLNNFANAPDSDSSAFVNPVVAVLT